MGRALGTPAIHNLWIPDGAKDAVVDRWERRSLLRKSLDEVFASACPVTEMKDSVESSFGASVARRSWSGRTSSTWVTR